MLMKRLILEYSVVCDNCGALAGYDRDDERAKWLAIETGYIHYDYLRNGKDCHSDYCPECNKKLPASERERMGRPHPSPMAPYPAQGRFT